MHDLISRQAAIDALEKEQSLVERPITETRWFDLGLRKARDVLCELPSVQQEEPSHEAVREYCRKRCLRIVDAVFLEKYAPSVRPEIIHCGECARCQIDEVFHDYWCDGRKVWKDHYCGYAERRTDE